MVSLPELQERLGDVSDRSIKTYEAMTLLLFLIMILIALIQVANRHVPFNHPWDLRWTIAWSVRFMLFTAFLGIGLTQIYNEDIIISAFRDWVKRNVRPASGSLYDFIVNLLTLFMLGFLVYATYNMMLSSWGLGTSPDFFFWFHRGYMYLILLTGLFVAFVHRVYSTLVTLYKASTPVIDRLRPYWSKPWN